MQTEPTQLTLFDFEPEINAAFRLLLYDKQGLPSPKIDRNWYPYRVKNQASQDKAFNAAKKRFNSLISTGLIGWAEILSTESHIAVEQWGDKDLVLKHYPNSTLEL